MFEIRKQTNIDLERQHETFLEYIDVSKKTVDSYKSGLKSLIEYLADNNISNPTRMDIRNYRDWLMLEHSANTVNSYMTAIREFFKYLDTYGIYDNIAADIKGARTSTTPKKQVLTKQQIINIYHSLIDPREKCAFSLLITTGLRGIEAINAMIEDIKIHNGERVLWVKKKNHSEKDEYVKISDLVFNDIKEYIGERKYGYIFVGNGNNNRGKQLTTKTMRLMIKTIFKRFGLNSDGFSLHSTRRTFATTAYDNGADIYSIQQVLSHKSVATTTIYLRAADRNKNDTELKVSDILM